MHASPRTLPLLAVIAVAALSGALAASVVEHAASAATIIAPIDDQELTTLLKYVKVDAAGNVTINGSNISIKGSQITVQGSAQTSIKGAIVTIN